MESKEEQKKRIKNRLNLPDAQIASLWEHGWRYNEGLKGVVTLDIWHRSRKAGTQYSHPIPELDVDLYHEKKTPHPKLATSPGIAL